MHPIRAAASVALLLSAVAAGATAPPRGKTTRLQGRVRLEGTPPSRQSKMIGVQTEVCGTERLDENLITSKDGGVANAVVLLKTPPGGGSAKAPEEARVDQRRCDFLPHVALIGKGGTVAFGNDDPILHNVRVSGAAEAMNQVPPPKATVRKTFKTPGPHRLRCDFHGWMSAYVFVTEHAYAAVTDANGRFQIDGLPPGRHPVKVWHEKLGELEGELDTARPGELRYPAAAVERPSAPTVEPGEF